MKKKYRVLKPSIECEVYEQSLLKIKVLEIQEIVDPYDSEYNTFLVVYTTDLSYEPTESFHKNRKLKAEYEKEALGDNVEDIVYDILMKEHLFY